MRYFKFILFIFFICFLCGVVSAQKVGLVLSGGGAAGLSHIGVIKALEEHDIPIDYITGTSMGGLIGGLYSSGYTIEEIEKMALSNRFAEGVQGVINEDNSYYYTKTEEDASIIRIKLSTEDLISNSIPTNLVSPVLLEYLLLESFSQPAAAANYDFDSLMIPFRCLASDIEMKKEVVFRSGSLSQAVRATTTYPFYFSPITIDGKLLYDGGLYNNFPSDIMYDDFFPDIIIGSNVSTNTEPPEEEDLLSQIKNMITSATDYSVICENGIIIEPKSDINVFDFSDPAKEILIGYNATIEQIDDIKRSVKERRTKDDLKKMREDFRSKFPDFIIGDIRTSSSINKPQERFVNSVMDKYDSHNPYTLSEFKTKYFRLAQDDKVRSVHPVATYNVFTGKFDVDLDIRKEKDLLTYFGGNFSSRPINFGFVGLKYNIFGKTPVSLMANSYFGKFYGSLHLKTRIDFGGRVRFALEPHLTYNRWDYFKSFTTFFEPSRPSYIVKNERFVGINALTAATSNTIIKLDVKYGETEDHYYQIDNFTPEDTADFTSFKLGTAGLSFIRNTLNRKQYASDGTKLEMGIRGVLGNELTHYGNTSSQIPDYNKYHIWGEAKLTYENYFAAIGPVKFGGLVEVLYSSRPFYENFTATMISTPAFQPIPESKTIFQHDFRANRYGAFGLRSIVEVRKNVEVRLEGYVFQPYRSIYNNEFNEAYLSEPFENRYYLASGALVFHSPIGPLSLSVNYYDQREEPWSLIFNFGFTIFNKSIYE